MKELPAEGNFYHIFEDGKLVHAETMSYERDLEDYMERHPERVFVKLDGEQMHTVKLQLSSEPDNAANGLLHDAGIWTITETNRRKIIRAMPVIGGGSGPLRGTYSMIIYEGHFEQFKKYATYARQQTLQGVPV
ncbi:hypothetical protein [Methanolobus sp. WCC5]|uniref:hypothetical protein n=1 Tax=Methanolobus sp. WCC5 TaxID=3125785 RepID=UPI0032560F0E